MALKTSSRIALRLLAVVLIFFLSYTILSDVGRFDQQDREDSPAALSASPVGAKEEGSLPRPTEEVMGAYGFSDALKSDSGAADATFDAKVEQVESGAPTRERAVQRQKAPPADRDESAGASAEVSAMAAPSAPPPAPSAPPAAITNTPVNEESRASEDESVIVVKRVENGRVVEAHVSNPRPGREALENSALRIVRQRRYQSGVTATETERIRIKKQ